MAKLMNLLFLNVFVQATQEGIRLTEKLSLQIIAIQQMDVPLAKFLRNRNNALIE